MKPKLYVTRGGEKIQYDSTITINLSSNAGKRKRKIEKIRQSLQYNLV